MWTNVFKIGGLRLISWFQFIPHESDFNAPPDKSLKIDQKDVAMFLVLSSHLQLEKDGFLTTWTNSFVGPWDPSQGLHNPDEKLKLWLFLPGRHSSVVESAQAAVSKLRVAASGLWLAPGDSVEVASALSQALRNRIERALLGHSYMRFGDVFSKCNPLQSEELFRKGHPTVEFVFAASEEAIFVHVIISAKHIRAILSSDMDRVSKQSVNFGHELPVIVSPHGMRGKITGYCPSDLVKQVYFSSSKSKNSNGFIGLPHNASQGSGNQPRGRNCFVEVTIGFQKSGGEKAFHSKSNLLKSLPDNINAEPSFAKGDQKGLHDNSLFLEKQIVYPLEAVLVPVVQTSFSRSSLKRFWLQNWTGPSLPGLSFVMHCAGSVESMNGSMVETNRIPQCGYDSSSNSNNSSTSSISCSCSDSDHKKTTGDGDLEADADSLSCRQSGLSSNDQLENCTKSGLKRPRTGMEEPLNQVETGVDQIGSSWDWDDDDRGVGMDIQALLSEFGDFGDFFENDSLPFGEPPGTAESEALMFPGPDCGDIGSSPMTVMDVSDQMLMPSVFQSLENISHLTSGIGTGTGTEESLSKCSDFPNTSMSSIPTTHNPVPSTSEFDHLIKAEALMTFAPEYGAIETPSSEMSSSVFRNPYLPKSRKVESPKSTLSNYMYGAAPPSSPCFDGTDSKIGVPATSKTHPGRNDANADDGLKQYYTYVESGKEQHDKRSLACSSSVITYEGVGTSPSSNFNSTSSVKSGHGRNEGTIGMGHIPLFTKNLLATDVESIMFQASMRSMRHLLLSSSSVMPSGLCGLTVSSSFPGDSSTMTDNLSGKFEVKKRESIPIKIDSDSDGGLLEGNPNPPMRVWRSVGVPKVSKPMNSPKTEVGSSLTHNSFNEESILSYGQRQPLQDLLDGMPLLVQQAASLIDVALDADCGDGPYCWLALQEQWRRGFPCGPSMIHAGCGGTLASCHSLDIAGVELVDPLSADVHASSIISLLQCDIKVALKSAFDALDGPLLVADWCKSRNRAGEVGRVGDCFSAESTMTECRDSSSAMSMGESMSPNISSTGGTSCLKSDVAKGDDTHQRKLSSDICGSELRPAVSVLPPPAILVGYQDDWLKTSASALQFWEKAPLEPYALQKPITYNVICPDIDPLTSAATDFFQQLGTVYETCKLGTHSPQSVGNQMEIDSGKWSSSGFVLLDCPQSMKIESSNASLVGSISDYFLSLSNGWDLASYLKSLSRMLKSLKLGPFISSNQKEGNSSSCAVIYVVCPFPEPIAILQTLIESCVSIESVNLQSDRERRSLLYNQVGKALNCSAAVDEASVSNVLVLSGFSIPKLVLQIVTVDVIFRVTNPSLNELVVLKETAFTVYNKARRISRGSCSDAPQSSTLSGRSPLMMNQMASSLHGTWRDCVASRMMGPSISREAEIEASLRSASWENTWQASRTGGLSCDPNRTESLLQDEARYMFEPLFILAEPGSIEHGISPTIFGSTASESSRVASDDSSGGYIQSANSIASVDAGLGSQLEASETDSSGSSQSMTPSLHCCYGWTEDWRWLVCIWTDSRGELLDSHIFPFGGTSSRQDTKGLQCLFVQVLHQGCQILQTCSSSETGVIKPRDFVITRIGSFYELEYLEWQKALSSVGGSDMKKWPLQLRRSASGGIAASSPGNSLQHQDINLIQDRTLPSSPGPMYSPHSKNSSFMKGALGQASARKQLMGGHLTADSSRGLLQWVQSISFVTVSVDHTLQLVFQADPSSLGGSQGGLPSYLEGFTPVKSLGSTSASYVLIPSPKMRFLPPTPLQLPTFLTAESPPLAHLLHSKGSAVPLSTGFVVSKAVPSMRKERNNMKEEWPSVLSVSLVDYYGGHMSHDKIVRGLIKQGVRGLGSEAKDAEIETHLILESVAAELHALSWLTVSPAYLERRTALPFHCDMVLRLRRLLHFADKQLCQQREK